MGPVKKAEIAVGDVESSGLVNRAVEGKLDSLYEVESDGILQSTAMSQLVSEETCKVRMVTYISWNRMLERSRALEASERSIAASMTTLVWGYTKLEQGRKQFVREE